MSIAEKFEVIADAVYDKGNRDTQIAFSKAITDNGTRVNYMRAFAYTNFAGIEFSQPIKPSDIIAHMFYSCYYMTELPKPIDFSEVFTTGTDNYGNRRSVFAYCYELESVPNLNMRAIGGIEEWFAFCKKLHTIELLRVNENTIYNSTFSNCENLQNLAFDGVIGQNISFKDSPLLTIKSLNNIIDHLKEFPTENSANITLHANSKALLGDEGLGRIEAKGWSYA